MICVTAPDKKARRAARRFVLLTVESSFFVCCTHFYVRVIATLLCFPLLLQKNSVVGEEKVCEIMSCCPVNSTPFLAPTYTNVGKIAKLPSSDVEAYVSNSEYVAGQPAVILIPDAFGWNTGRIRSLNDMFASEGYYALVPKIMQPCVDGAQDGDGYPADGDMPGMGKFFSTIPYEGVLKPKIDSIIGHLRALGAPKICLVGFWCGEMISQMMKNSQTQPLS